MQQQTKDLLNTILPNKEQQDIWINGHNLHFNMSPAKMIETGREEEVISYLDFAVYGPY